MTERLYDQPEFADLTRDDLLLINMAWIIHNSDRDLAGIPESICEAIGDAAVRLRALSDLPGAAEQRLLDARC
jgi:hypothetical protein